MSYQHGASRHGDTGDPTASHSFSSVVPGFIWSQIIGHVEVWVAHQYSVLVVRIHQAILVLFSIPLSVISTVSGSMLYSLQATEATEAKATRADWKSMIALVFVGEI